MSRFATSRPELWSAIAILFPLGLWAMLWLSISPGSFSEFLHPGSPTNFINGLRAILPFAASGLATAIIVFKLANRRPRGFGFFSPLGLATAYGLVGLTATLQSPDATVALRWGALYLSVPLVLTAAVWGTDPLDHLRRLVNSTWLVLILASTALFGVALLYLDLTQTILHPDDWLKCNLGGWYNLTSGRLRETGVGRYAAIAGIIAISGLWQQRWRPVWLFVLLTSVLLLLVTGARGAFGGFAAGALLTVLLHAGKRELLVGSLALLILLPIAWSAGVHQNFWYTCMLGAGVPKDKVAAAIGPPGQQAQEVQLSTQELPRQEPPVVQVDAPSDPAVQLSTQELPRQEPPVGQVDAPSASAQTSQTAVAPDQVQLSQRALQTEAVVQRDSSDLVQVVGGIEQRNTKVDSDVGETRVTLVTPQPSSAEVLSSTPEESKKTEHDFFEFTGRTAVWAEGLKRLEKSPLIGFGFHADRLILKTHMHNSLMQALVQAGIIGATLFVAAIMFGWVLFFRLIRNLSWLPLGHKHLVIQCGAILAFLTARGFPESSGAFFGVDWLILAPILFYLHVVNDKRLSLRAPA